MGADLAPAHPIPTVTPQGFAGSDSLDCRYRYISVEALHEVSIMKLRSWSVAAAWAGLSALLVTTSAAASGRATLRMRAAPVVVAQAPPAPVDDASPPAAAAATGAPP